MWNPILFDDFFSYFVDTCSYKLPRSCERGGYQDPTDCFKCKCPDGFGGMYCEQVAPPVNGRYSFRGETVY